MSERELSDEQLLRYNRQIMLPQFDIAGQQRLLASRVLIVGLGGLGSPVALYLAAAGVGHLVLADHDRVELSNLQRQIAHGTQDIGRFKVDSAADRVAALNPEVQVQALRVELQGEELDALVAQADAVVDCTDNFAIRFALNAACVRHRKIMVSGAAIRLEGQVSLYDLRRDDSPCYHCLYADVDEAQLTCSEAGVMAPLVGIVGSVQAMETIKVLTGLGQALVGRLLMLDALTMSWREFRIKRDPHCKVCAQR